MNPAHRIDGLGAPLPIANLDTDQIMPKQFLTGIDKTGLDRGLLYDLRYDSAGQSRSDCVLNRADYAGTSVLVAGANFGCGSSREHAVWGLQQFGIRAIIAPSFAEIFFSNAMNNGLMLVTLPDAVVQQLLADAANPATRAIAIDVRDLSVQSHSQRAAFTLSPRYQRMFLEGQDVIGATLALQDQIQDFAERHWTQQPWLRDVAASSVARLERRPWKIHPRP
ncbi:3-isopropylmalate dehydratase small subunit [Rhodoferax sp.]|uniref:3-isopropylmalate dehydratase small subunit n=1 Tax=Rhodoferax sp. TaxID=50421 RepID=UPI00374CF72E